MSDKSFFKTSFKFTKTRRFVSLMYPGRLVNGCFVSYLKLEDLNCNFRAEIAKIGIQLTLNTKRVLSNKFWFAKTGLLRLGCFVSWALCNWKFGKWTFCILNVLYSGLSVTRRLVTGCFVIGRFVTMGIQRILLICLYLLCVTNLQH